MIVAHVRLHCTFFYVGEMEVSESKRYSLFVLVVVLALPCIDLHGAVGVVIESSRLVAMRVQSHMYVCVISTVLFMISLPCEIQIDSHHGLPSSSSRASSLLADLAVCVGIAIAARCPVEERETVEASPCTAQAWLLALVLGRAVVALVLGVHLMAFVSLLTHWAV